MHVWQGVGLRVQARQMWQCKWPTNCRLRDSPMGSDGVRQCRLAGAVGRLVASTLAQLPDTVWLGLAWLSARQSDTLASACQWIVNGNANSSCSSSSSSTGNAAYAQLKWNWSFCSSCCTWLPKINAFKDAHVMHRYVVRTRVIYNSPLPLPSPCCDLWDF